MSRARAAFIERARARALTRAGTDNRVTLYVWYDNEFGYSCQVVRLVQKLAGIVPTKFPPVELMDGSMEEPLTPRLPMGGGGGSGGGSDDEGAGEDEEPRSPDVGVDG